MRLLKKALLSALLAALFVTPLASAQNSIIPYLDPENRKSQYCNPDDTNWNIEYGQYYADQANFQKLTEESEIENVLACAVKTGHVRIWMLPFLIRDVLNFLIGIAGLISILMIMVGAYYYIVGGLSDDKEKGKNIITYAIGGLVLTILSWTLVNFVLLILTS